MAGILGVQFLDKIEKCVDFRAISRENNIIKVWYCISMGYWSAHWFGIRWGVFELQHESLKAFSPLFSVAGKSIYARSVAYHLYCIENNPRLRAMLRTAPFVNLTDPGHFFAYDRLWKHSNFYSITDKLLCDYIGDNIKGSQQRNVQSRKEKKIIQLLEEE
ncbi:hypothetical protein GLOIN_2v1768552 [Rhizophagus clarus]|uniref:Uncharacterized protein n=1 Tax=Rhizophagus clarus TaxID=94130 RepID=A0A8H3M4B6_9GLOM|nr:hypothetical protein GLOIN_2v1768552 [Rhizophagus clarus]